MFEKIEGGLYANTYIYLKTSSTPTSKWEKKRITEKWTGSDRVYMKNKPRYVGGGTGEGCTNSTAVTPGEKRGPALRALLCPPNPALPTTRMLRLFLGYVCN